MSGDQTRTTDSTSSPWEPAQPALRTALSGAMDAYNQPGNGLAALNSNVTAGQDAQLANAAGGQSSRIAGLGQGNLADLMGNGGLSREQSGAVSGMGSALGSFNSQNDTARGYLTPYADGSHAAAGNPYTRQVVGTAMQDAANSINSQFSGAGRYGSGAQTGALADRLGNIANTAYMNDYNTAQDRQLSAIGQLNGLNQAGLSGNLSGQGAIAGIGQQGVANNFAAPAAIAGMDQARNLDATNQTRIGAQQMDYAQQQLDAPWTRVNNLAGVAGSIGALGNQGHSTTTTSGGELQQIIGGATAGLGAMSNIARAGGFAAMFSDERMKEDIEKVGKLDDGQNIYAYNYKDGGPRQIGLLAQEVEKKEPGAVQTDEASGMKMVDYGRATAKAAHMGKKRKVA